MTTILSEGDGSLNKLSGEKSTTHQFNLFREFRLETIDN